MVWVGIDDTDSHEKGCTTYVMYNMIKEFLRTRSQDRVLGYPRLIRLNPNIPFKTRGNAAVAVNLDIDPGEALELAEWAVDAYSHRVGKTSPGIVISSDDSHHWIYWRALTGIVTRDVAERWVRKVNALSRGGRGVVGALAAIMADLRGDSTLELLAYHEDGKPEVDYNLVKLIDEATAPFTFENIGEGNVLIQPHGKDPVVYGIRGDSPYHLLIAASIISSTLNIEEKWIIYVTNQGTEAHMYATSSRPYGQYLTYGVLKGRSVSNEGNVLLDIDGVKAFAYRHYGFKMLDKARGLLAYGGLKPGPEGIYMYVEGGLATLIDATYGNPRCPRCGGILKANGRLGELKCSKCGFRTYVPRRMEYRSLIIHEEPRQSELRHLHKPISRLGLEGLANSLPRPTLWIV